MPDSAGAITRLLHALREGDSHAEQQLLDLTYAELRRRAQTYMRHERRNHTLQASALVHEAYLRINRNTAITADNRRQFFALAARAMRNVLVDHARARDASKRGGREFVLSLDDEGARLPELEHEASGRWALDAAKLLALDEALKALTVIDKRQAEIVELRYFTGAELADLANHFAISERTISRELKTAHAWLQRHMDGGGNRQTR
jgi:RNA polymerase sigma factor (TIGR02999 family)